MNQPTVCAIMLTAHRPEYARRAAECFRRQTYDPARRMLLVLDTGHEGLLLSLGGADCENESSEEPNLRYRQ